MKRPTNTVMFAFIAMCVASASNVVYAAPPNEKAQTIAIGDSVEQAKARLTAAKVKFGPGTYEFSRVDDQDDLRCEIVENNMNAAIFFSKSKQVITGISIETHPPGQPQKIYRNWLSAESITFEPDGSYWVHFSAPPHR